MSACNTCTSDFSCGRLALVLKVLESTPDLDHRPNLKNAYDSVNGALQGLKWSYPDSPSFCGLAGNDHDIQKLTAALIEELRLDRTLWERCSPNDSPLLDECHHE